MSLGKEREGIRFRRLSWGFWELEVEWNGGLFFLWGIR